MNVAEKICEKARELPEPLANRVLEFIEKLTAQQVAGIEDLKRAQGLVMSGIWENGHDDVWNEF